MQNISQFAPGEAVLAAVLNPIGQNANNALTSAINSTINQGWLFPGLIGTSVSGSVATFTFPAPVALLTPYAQLTSAHGTVTGQDTTTYSVDASALEPSSGNTTVYFYATYVQIQQQPYTVIGAPQGHPSYDPNFVPYTAYAVTQDSFSVSVGAFVPAGSSEVARALLLPIGTLYNVDITHRPIATAPVSTQFGTYPSDIITVDGNGRLTNVVQKPTGSQLYIGNNSTTAVYSFTVPANVYSLVWEMWSAGQSGIAITDNYTIAGYGGLSGGYLMSRLSVRPGQIFNVSIAPYGGPTAITGYGSVDSAVSSGGTFGAYGQKGSAPFGSKVTTVTYGAGVGTFTVPYGVYQLFAETCGGGGGSSGCTGSGLNSNLSGGGGGGGGYSATLLAVIPGQQFGYSVGQGGPPQTGGATSYFAGMVANGGGGSYFVGAYSSAGGFGGTATGGNYQNSTGSDGSDGMANGSPTNGTPNFIFAGNGGGGPWGGGARAANGGSIAGKAPGAGAGGAYDSTGSKNLSGNAGADGILKIITYSYAQGGTGGSAPRGGLGGISGANGAFPGGGGGGGSFVNNSIVPPGSGGAGAVMFTWG